MPDETNLPQNHDPEYRYRALLGVILLSLFLGAGVSAIALSNPLSQSEVAIIFGTATIITLAVILVLLRRPPPQRRTSRKRNKILISKETWVTLAIAIIAEVIGFWAITLIWGNHSAAVTQNNAPIATASIGDGVATDTQKIPFETLIITPTLTPTPAVPSTLPPLPTETSIATPVYTLTPTAIITPVPTDILTEKPDGSLKQWCDNLYDNVIDESLWLPPADEDLIYERDGSLHFNSFLESTEYVDDIMQTRAADLQIVEITFTITLQSAPVDLPGAAGAAVYLPDDRNFSINVGPSPNGPVLELLICSTPLDTNEKCRQPVEEAVALGNPLLIKISWVNRNTEFYVDGTLRHREPADEPITKLRFYMYADPGSEFHATIDNVCLR